MRRARRAVFPAAAFAAILAFAASPSCAAPRTAPQPLQSAPPPAEPAPAAAASPAPPTAPPAASEEAPPLLQLPADVRPTRYALDLEVVPARDDGFRGLAEITIALDRPRSTIWLHARNLAVSEATVETAGVGRLEARFAQVDASGVARLDLPRPIGPGAATIRIAWSGRWGPEGAGLFRARRGEDSYAATQFEPLFARNAFPCFDEPRFKTPFDVSVSAPDGLVVVSNAAEASSAPAPGGLRRVTFAPTRPLPSYLVFWTAGPYDVVESPAPPDAVRASPLPVRFVVPHGRGAEAAFAREAGAALVAELELWFGMPFPYPKLDHVAVPGLSGAMENAGAIAYAETALLFDPRRQAAEARKEIAVVMAHEMAHHWFGDLVTLPWWTELWLNESFADWMGYRAVHAWRPEWGADVDALHGTARALAADELASARAVRKPLDRIEDVDAQFDVMSYEKGGALLGMVERWIGEDRFRDGVRRYLSARADGTGSTDALLAELSAAAGRDVAAPFRSFLDQPGAPLVRAAIACDASGPRVRLEQSRARPRGSSAPSTGSWSIPVCVRYEAAGARREACTLLDGAAGQLQLPGACPAWVMPNAGAAGYFRWTLAPADLAHLRARGVERLATVERLSLAESVLAAERAGALPYGDAMDALAALARDPDPDVAAAPLRGLAFARDWLVAPAARPAVEAVTRRLYRPIFKRLGWSARPVDSSAMRTLRARVAWALADTGRDPVVRREAARLGAAYAGVADGKLHPEAADPEMASVALAIAIEDGGAPVFEAVRARLAEARDETTQGRLLGALAGAEDPALAARFAEVLRSPDLPLAVRVRAVSPRGDAAPAVRTDPPAAERRLALLAANLDGWAASLPPFFVVRLPFLARAACDDSAADRLRALFAPRLGRLPGAERFLAETVEAIRICAARRAADAEAATEWARRAAR